MKESTTEGSGHYKIHVNGGKSHGDSGLQKMKMQKSRHPTDIYKYANIVTTVLSYGSSIKQSNNS